MDVDDEIVDEPYETDRSENLKELDSHLLVESSETVNQSDQESSKSDSSPAHSNKNRLFTASVGLVSYTIDDEEEDEEVHETSDLPPTNEVEPVPSQLPDSLQQVTTSEGSAKLEEVILNELPDSSPSGTGLVPPPGTSPPDPQDSSRSEQQPQQQRPTAVKVELPPESTRSCDTPLQDKVYREVKRIEYCIGHDPNRKIQDNKEFRNPSIYEKLVELLGIKENGTNFPKEMYDPYRWTSSSNYKALASIQNQELDRINKAQKRAAEQGSSSVTGSTVPSTADPGAGSKPPIKSVTGGSVVTGFVEPKKRSKWDNESTTTAVPVSEIEKSQQSSNAVVSM